MRKFRGLIRGVGNQPLLLVAVIVVLTGLVAALLSRNSGPQQSLIFNPKKPSQFLVLGESTSKTSGQKAESQTNSNPSSQSSSGSQAAVPAAQNQAQSPDSSPPSTGTGLVSNPLPVQKSPVIVPSSQPTPTPTPQPLPCSSCRPAAGRFCPLAQSDHIVYPCSPCGGTGAPVELACREVQQ